MIAPGSTGETAARKTDLIRALHALNLAELDEHPKLEPLSGGISSDIWRVDLKSGPVCVKRALPFLKVPEVWKVSVERNSYEAEWMRVVSKRVPGCTPRLIAEDREAGLFVMEYLPPEGNRVWKTCLSEGEADQGFSAKVGTTLGKIHAATAGDGEIAQRFDTDEIFSAIRLDPYFLECARRHAAWSDRLTELSNRTLAGKMALVHGDVSPKNILVGATGPVIIDAECAWYGDPAFDLGFCLNHLLLKTLWVPEAANRFLECYTALVSAYRAEVSWEPPVEMDRRTATLLPALILARVDGKSPVEYITEQRDKQRIRATAGALLTSPPDSLAEVAEIWRREMAR